jgi:hypothetical protein
MGKVARKSDHPVKYHPRQKSLTLEIKIFDGERFLTDLPVKYLSRQKPKFYKDLKN